MDKKKNNNKHLNLSKKLVSFGASFGGFENKVVQKVDFGKVKNKGLHAHARRRKLMALSVQVFH